MTARPDEVVAEIGPVYTLLWAGTDSVASIVNDHNLKVGDKLVPLSALQSANARLADANERGDWWRDKFDADTDELQSLRRRLAAVLALAERLAAESIQHAGEYSVFRSDEENTCSEALCEFKQDAAEAIRRAAAGEGDASE